MSAQSSFTLAFTTPTLTLVSGQGASGGSTLGGQLVTLTGTSFGPSCGVPGASVDGASAGVNCPYVTATYSKGSISVSTGLPIVYSAFPCAVLQQTYIVCATAPGTGAGHVWNLTIGGLVANVPLW